MMEAKQILDYCLSSLDGTILVESWGEKGIFYNPGLILKRGVYVLTIKEKNGDNDKASNLDMLAFAIANGMTQGVLPLIGYNYAANKWKRMRSVIKTAFIYSVAVALAGAVLLFVCAVPMVKGFIDDTETVAYGQHFLRIICITCPAVSVTMMIISVFQATGQKTRPMILSLLRKGGLDVPFMFLMNTVAGADGIPWATPIADSLAMGMALVLFIPYRKQLKETMDNFSEKE